MQAATSKVKTAILYLKSSDLGRGQRQAQSKLASLDIAIDVVGKKRKRETNQMIVMRLRDSHHLKRRSVGIMNERHGFHIFPHLQLSIFPIKMHTKETPMKSKTHLDGSIIHVRALELPWIVLFFYFFDFWSSFVILPTHFSCDQSTPPNNKTN